MSTFSGKRRARSTLTVSPAVEKTRSEGVEEAWTHKYLLAKLANTGIWSLFCHHHWIGSTELTTPGMLRYACSSLLTFSDMVGLLK